MSSEAPEKKRAVLSMALVFIAGMIVAGVLGSAAYFLGYLTPAPAPPTSEESDGKPLHWRSPMDPREVYDKPGKDSMGMDLVPVYAEEEAAGPPGTIRIDPVTVQNIGVKTKVIERKPLSREIRTVGRVAYDEQMVRQIAPKISGWIERQHVNFPGQVVQKGEPLLEIYSPKLVATQEEYLVALRYRERLEESPFPGIVEGGESLLRSTEARLRYWDITDAQVRALRERGEITRAMTLFAPFKGIVLKKSVPEGGHVMPGQALYEIADISTVWVYADIYEYEAPWLQVGQEAEVTLAYKPGTSYRGKVIYVYPYLNNKTRTLQVRTELRNSTDLALKPDMWANVILRSVVAREGLAVPIQAVIRTGKRDVALIALEGGRFVPRELRLGAQVGDEFEVLGGLEEGERVVTSAQFLINSESSLRAAIGKMTDERGGHAPQATLPAPEREEPEPTTPHRHPAKE